MKNINNDILTTKQIKQIFNKFKQLRPEPTTELCYNNEFELLIAVMLSAQATDVRVNKVTAALFKVANTPKQILKFTLDELCDYIRSIGLFRTKAQNILKTCKLIVKQFNSEIPRTREELESLPGVGRKTANVLLNTLWQQPTIAVDTHVFRVANRIGLVNNTKTTLATELELLQVIPKKFIIYAHHWLILHGRYICKAIHPLCEQCPINDLCKYYQTLSKY